MPNGQQPGSEGISEDDPTRPDTSESGTPDSADYYGESHNLPEDNTDLRTGVSYADLYDFPYSFVELQNSYKISGGYVQMPLATLVGSPSVGSTRSRSSPSTL